MPLCLSCLEKGEIENYVNREIIMYKTLQKNVNKKYHILD